MPLTSRPNILFLLSFISFILTLKVHLLQESDLRMLEANKMSIMMSKFIILHFKGTIMFTQFSDERMAKFQLQLASLMLFFPAYNMLILFALCCDQFD